MARAPRSFGSTVPNLMALVRDPLELFQRAAREQEDVLRVVLAPGITLFLVNSPELITEVLDTHLDRFGKPRQLGDIRPAVGENLQTSEGPSHDRHRALAEPVMAPPAVARYGGTVVEQGVRMADGWQDGAVVDLHPQMLELMFRISGRALFDCPVEQEEPAVQDALETVLARCQRYNLPLGGLLDKLPLPSTTRMRKGRQQADAFLDRMIARNRGGEPDRSILATLLSAVNGTALTDAEARDEALFLLLAARETIGDVLTWIWYELSRSEEIQTSLQGELDQVLGSQPPTAADVPRLHYLHGVVNEGLRMYPVGWGILRQLKAGYEMGGFSLPKGSYTLVSPYVTQRDERFFPEPTRFHPERWGGPTPPAVMPGSYLPFSIGARSCIGEHFASMALPLLVATLAQKWSFRRVEGEPPAQAVPQFAIRPKRGVKVGLVRR